ncbi:MAG TPA: PQQ-dependent sugar dehydrogenase, partial [Acidimicrobiia bacterium]|nr:PQQ-dependent sugar dehydrogenase [Acidimicrobiia bacterium]
MSTKFTKVIVISVALVLALSSCSSEKSSSEKVDKKSQDTTTTRPAQEPVLKTQVILDELSKPWDIAFVDNKSFIFTEKNGTLNIFKNGSSKKITSIKDVKNEGEGGLLGLD